jgi:3-hydroxyacyl-[acyl-carrier-protein] dehydratase
MLNDDFYRIKTFDESLSGIDVVLELNPDHNIFKGHFPGAPVVPGVCMMKMVKEVMEMKTGELMMLSKADSMKFLSVIDPRVNEIVKIDLSYKMKDATFDVIATLSAEESVCFKFKGRFVVA